MIVRGDVYDLGEVRYGDTGAVRSQALRAIEADGSAFPRIATAEAERVVRSLDPSVAARIVATRRPPTGRRS